MKTVLFSAIVLCLASVENLPAGYSTPNTGVDWTLDSLVAYSGGTLAGTFPNYTMNDTLTIAVNDRLTVQAGSVISVAQGAGKGFTVFGVLRAIGTIADTIIVKGAVPTAGYYRGFRFEDSSVDSACMLSYCRIQDAVEGVYCLNANPRISNSLFTNNSSNAIRCFGASPEISYCTFTENRQSAITANVNSSPFIEHNIFASNNSQNTGARNQIAIGGQGANNPVIRDNEISNRNYFRAGGISLVTLSSTDVCNAIVENNYIHDNSFGIVVQGLSAGGTLQPIIRYNRIENNRINPDSMNSGSGIAVYTGGPTNAPIITGNLIKGNYWGITCVSASGLTSSPRPDIGDLGNADTTDDGWNIFDDNHNGGVIYQLYNNGTQNISAQNNYWGTGDSTTIESWITHQPDSSVFGFVNCRPYGIPGMGQPDSFSARRIGTYQVLLQWSFPPHPPSSSIRILWGFDSLMLFLAATLPDTQTSYVFDVPPTGAPAFYALSSFNRFGGGETTFVFYPILLPGVPERSEIPTGTGLHQNFPNPFNPTTQIQFTIADRARTVLKVFDQLGGEVATLVNEIRSPGTYAVTWDATGLASGVYFCRLIAGSFSETKRIMVLK